MESTETAPPLSTASGGGIVASAATAAAAAGAVGVVGVGISSELANAAIGAAAGAGTAAAPITYTRDDVSEHCFEGDVWIIIRDRVYDVSKFVERHPGGSEIVYGKRVVDSWRERDGETERG